MLRTGIADISGIANIADITDVVDIGTDITDIGTDIADIATGIADIVNSADIADWMLRTCYGPYIPDSISTQRGLGKIGSQYTGCRTDGTSKAIE